MSVPRIPKRPSRDEFTGDYAEDLDGLLGVIGDAQEALITAASGVVTPYFRTDYYKHGTEKRIRTPLPVGMKCTAIAAVKCIGTTMGTDGRPTTATFSCTVENTNWRSLGRTQDNGEVVGVTVQYDLAHTKPVLQMYRSAVQSIPSGGADTTVVFDTVVRNIGGIISHSSSGVWSVSESGFYQLTLHAPFANAGDYTAIEARWFINGAVVPISTFMLAAFTGMGTFECSGQYPLSSTDTVTAQVYQTNGAAAARNLSNGSGGVRASISRLYNDTLPTARVTLMFFGE
jgi:hypothetical protein